MVPSTSAPHLPARRVAHPRAERDPARRRAGDGAIEKPTRLGGPAVSRETWARPDHNGSSETQWAARAPADCGSPGWPGYSFQWSVDPALADRRGSPGRPASRYRRPGEPGSSRQSQQGLRTARLFHVKRRQLATRGLGGAGLGRSFLRFGPGRLGMRTRRRSCPCAGLVRLSLGCRVRRKGGRRDRPSAARPAGGDGCWRDGFAGSAPMATISSTARTDSPSATMRCASDSCA